MKESYEKKELERVKSHLRNRKRLETLLNERRGSEDQLKEVLEGIERAKGSEEVSLISIFLFPDPH